MVHGRRDGAPCSAVESMRPGHGNKSTDKYIPFKIRFRHQTKENENEKMHDVPCYDHGKPIRGEKSVYFAQY